MVDPMVWLVMVPVFYEEPKFLIVLYKKLDDSVSLITSRPTKNETPDRGDKFLLVLCSWALGRAGNSLVLATGD
jgi:hypothetical protein